MNVQPVTTVTATKMNMGTRLMARRALGFGVHRVAKECYRCWRHLPGIHDRDMAH